MKKDILHMKIDGELKKALQDEAERQNRNLSNLVETVLKAYMEKKNG
ncbi:CopG family transcriptional regulator [Halomonas sp. 141]|jgi:predicted HicB family RNase H-like nuclease|nr:CopG family transcriptional regulator [Halomonas sp.]PJX14826.1 CopG family transcriptional regulator [Halomonas sp. 141]